MLVIGVIGRNGAGKDALVDYLHERCSIPTLSAGDVARTMAEDQGIPATRENLHAVSRRVFREQGRDTFMRQVIEEIEAHDWRAVGVAGVRTPTDVRTLEEQFGDDFLLVHVQVPARIRYERAQERGEARDPQSYEEFREQDAAEEDLFDIQEAAERADLTIDNSGSLEEFYRRIEERVVQGVLVDEELCEKRKKV